MTPRDNPPHFLTKASTKHFASGRRKLSYQNEQLQVDFGSKRSGKPPGKLGKRHALQKGYNETVNYIIPSEVHFECESRCSNDKDPSRLLSVCSTNDPYARISHLIKRKPMVSAKNPKIKKSCNYHNA